MPGSESGEQPDSFSFWWVGLYAIGLPAFSSTAEDRSPAVVERRSALSRKSASQCPEASAGGARAETRRCWYLLGCRYDLPSQLTLGTPRSSRAIDRRPLARSSPRSNYDGLQRMPVRLGINTLGHAFARPRPVESDWSAMSVVRLRILPALLARALLCGLRMSKLQCDVVGCPGPTYWTRTPTAEKASHVRHASLCSPRRAGATNGRVPRTTTSSS